MIDVQFIDAGRQPTQPPDPKHPDGVWVDLAADAKKSCTRNLPHPAPRCGRYEITCQTCGYRAVITVAGRADDPSMITMPCRAN